MKITMNNVDLEKAQKLNEKFKIPLLTASILSRRGIKEEDIKYYMEEDIVFEHSPFLVDDIFTAVERIGDALDTEEGKSQEKILIFGDRDVDGITATAIMYKSLVRLGGVDVHTRLPHGDEGYGLSMELCREIIDGGYTLLITVDNGISAVEEIRFLEKNGVDVIVLDHHIPGDSLPPACAIFDPKVSGIGYPYDGLAGCACAMKLAWALEAARTPLFNSAVILLHATPNNGTIRVDAVRVENLIEVRRESDEFIIGEKSDLYSSPLFSLLSSSTPILVLDKDTELTLLRKAFGHGVDIALEDFRGNLEKIIPQAKGKSLFDLALNSRSAKYQSGQAEIETLLSLFRSVSIYSFPALTRAMEEIETLAAIGTIADLMPLTNENRLIVKKGLRLLSTRPPKTLSYLLSKQNLISKPLTVSNVSFKITPVLNASGRMGEPETALKLLISQSDKEIETLTDNLLDLNIRRQKVEEEVLENIKPKALFSLSTTKEKFIVVEDESIPRGLTGALASKLANEHNVPALVLATKDDVVFGSLRCFEPYNAKDFLSLFSDYFLDYGGHKRASGLRMEKEKKESFLTYLYSYISEMEDERKSDECVCVDATILPEDLENNIWSALSFFQPFGQESENLKFYLPEAVIREAYHVGNNDKYMRFSLECGKYIWPCVWWNAENGDIYTPGSRVSIVFTPEVNWWRGNGTEQLSIEKIEKL